MKRTIVLVLALIFSGITLFAQKKDKSLFKEYAPGYYQNVILKDVRDVKEKKEPAEVDKRFQMDMSGIDIPNKMSLYKNVQWYNPTISQGNAGTCWAFSTTSYYETEVYRLTGQKIKISEIFTVYWEYVEKAKRYIQERGNSNFSEGSEANAVTRIYRDYGTVPEDVYTGLPKGQKFHSHDQMVKEMTSYLESVKARNAWNETEAIATIKEIMNHYIGQPPANFTYNGKNYTPKTFMSDVLKLKLDDYVEIMSLEQEPFWQQAEYKVPDNWWHSKEYYNVPLDEFMKAVKGAIRNGYTMAIGGDVSEPGMDRATQAAMIPTFDIPSDYIDDDARQFRFSNQTTGDDHGMHLVGYLEKNGKDWYLIKDSSSGSRNNDEKAPEFGFYFFHEDYFKLKMLGITVHKDAVKDLLKKFNK
ncbi:MAG: peptidase C1 [Bacteroidia bacterium]|nr:peptidase C1 [Bacteroidia bacterium]